MLFRSINYDVPRDPEDYIHRIGRTARAAATGSAMTFVSEDEQGRFHQIEKFIERDIRKAELPEAVGEGPKYAPAESRGRGGRGGRGRNGRNAGDGQRGEWGGRRRNRRGRGANGGASAEVSIVGVERQSVDAARPQAGAEDPISMAQMQPDNDHGSGRGEGNRGARDRKRRHRGGRRHRRGNKSTEHSGSPAGSSGVGAQNE